MLIKILVVLIIFLLSIVEIKVKLIRFLFLLNKIKKFLINNNKLIIICDYTNNNQEKYNIINYINKIIFGHNILFNIDQSEIFNDFYNDHIKETTSINIILHTHGGYVTSSSMIFNTLFLHKGKINIYVPRYAFSAGTFIALTATKLFLNKISALGPTDPMILVNKERVSCTSVFRLKEVKKKIKEKYEIRILEAKKDYNDNMESMNRVLQKRGYDSNTIDKITKELGDGKHSHEQSFDFEYLKSMGLKFCLDYPYEIEKIYDILLR